MTCFELQNLSIQITMKTNPFQKYANNQIQIVFNLQLEKVGLNYTFPCQQKLKFHQNIATLTPRKCSGNRRNRFHCLQKHTVNCLVWLPDSDRCFWMCHMSRTFHTFHWKLFPWRLKRGFLEMIWKHNLQFLPKLLDPWILVLSKKHLLANHRYGFICKDGTSASTHILFIISGQFSGME